MLPWPLVLSMLISVNAHNHLLSAAAVRSATAVASTTGAAAGAAAAAAASNPRGALNVLTIPLRVINAPFYYLLGGYAADRRLRTLELADSTLQEAQQQFIEQLREKNLTFDALKISLSDEYIGKIRAKLNAGGGALNFGNPVEPSLCSVGSFTDPFQETYTIIVLNELGQKILIGVFITVAVGSFIYLLIYVFRRSVRYGLRAYKAAKKIVLEERMRDDQHLLRQNSVNQKLTQSTSINSENYLNS